MNNNSTPQKFDSDHGVLFNTTRALNIGDDHLIELCRTLDAQRRLSIPIITNLNRLDEPLYTTLCIEEIQMIVNCHKRCCNIHFKDGRPPLFCLFTARELILNPLLPEEVRLLLSRELQPVKNGYINRFAIVYAFTHFTNSHKIREQLIRLGYEAYTDYLLKKGRNQFFSTPHYHQLSVHLRTP